ncbi:hypothetical protein [Oscillibacter sp.]|uniref:hypothetical protein n=1 Tax=Oscillibacter sp. TaxID=1945593 RepID=UPI00289ECA2E|nr:hypothetical protein [Oscillibacter sp.]
MCRFIANSWDELQKIDRIARLHQWEGMLEPVGLRIIPQRFDDGKRPGFPEELLPAFAGKIRTLPTISVRGCLPKCRGTPGDSGGALASGKNCCCAEPNGLLREAADYLTRGERLLERLDQKQGSGSRFYRFPLLIAL